MPLGSCCCNTIAFFSAPCVVVIKLQTIEINGISRRDLWLPSKWLSHNWKVSQEHSWLLVFLWEKKHLTIFVKSEHLVLLLRSAFWEGNVACSSLISYSDTLEQRSRFAAQQRSSSPSRRFFWANKRLQISSGQQKWTSICRRFSHLPVHVS